MNRIDLSVRAAVALLVTVALAGCASKTPAPVVERLPTPAAKPAPAPTASPRPETYTVKRGDTLYSIALENGMDVRELAAMNNITDPSKLAVGQVLRVRPAAPAVTTTETGVQVRPIAGTAPIEARPLGTEPGRPTTPAAAPAEAKAPAAAPGAIKTEPKAQKLPYSEENLALLQREDARPPAAATPAPRTEPAPAAKPESPPVAKVEPTPAAPVAPARPAPDADEPDRVDWSWPYGGRLLAGFSDANKGIDLAGKPGDPVNASAAGRVVYTGSAIRGYGQLVIIKHNDTYLSAYAHNSKILVKEGQTVAKGQRIDEVGATDADQPKLHFEIRRQGKPVDPMRYLPER